MGSTGRKDYSYQDSEEIELPGSGGNADVCKSRITHDDEEPTVGITAPRMSEYETVDTPFFDESIQEAELWAQIDDYENVISGFDWGQDPDPWIAIEYMDSGNLVTVGGELSPIERADLSVLQQTEGSTPKMLNHGYISGRRWLSRHGSTHRLFG